jgi:hypothetical protein
MATPGSHRKSARGYLVPGMEQGWFGYIPRIRQGCVAAKWINGQPSQGLYTIWVGVCMCPTTPDIYLESWTPSILNYPESNLRLNDCVAIWDTFDSTAEVTPVLKRRKFWRLHAIRIGTLIAQVPWPWRRAEPCHHEVQDAPRPPFGVTSLEAKELKSF